MLNWHHRFFSTRFQLFLRRTRNSTVCQTMSSSEGPLAGGRGFGLDWRNYDERHRREVLIPAKKISTFYDRRSAFF